MSESTTEQSSREQEREALRDARYFVELYARRNPRFEHDGEMQDPSGVNACLERIAALAAPMPQPEPTSKGEKLALMPYEPTEAMRWAAKNLDPVLTHDNIRALWSAMWVAAYRSQQREPQEAAEPWEDGNGVIRNGVLPDAPQEAGKPVECERCELPPEAHTAAHWCDNQSFREASKPAWKCADRLNDCRELCGSSQCFSKEAGKGEPVAEEKKEKDE